ncbi:MAG: 50S ribosome-binding GTPase [Planctomycetes bacterium]|nr:50S ribosome-binding GTPase [Planctomycetota bacterium]
MRADLHTSGALVVRELSPRGSGAVAIVAVRGDSALRRVAALLKRVDLAVGVPQLVRLAHAGSDIDEALVCALSEREVELHLHGSPVLVRELIAALNPIAAQSAPEPAIAAARAAQLLPHAASEAGARILLAQAEGAWHAFIAGLATAPDPLTLIQAVAAGTHAAARAITAPLVVLAGPVNAGKSTLFNLLAGEERAITAAEPGTTRDLVRATARLGHYVVEWVDTAGERAPAGAASQAEIEQAGITRGRELRARADLVLWLCAAGAPSTAAFAPDPAASTPVVSLITQADRLQSKPAGSVSALFDPLAARRTVENLVLAALRLPPDPFEPGAPRAFDAQSRAALAVLLSAGDAVEARRAARDLLERGAA